VNTMAVVPLSNRPAPLSWQEVMAASDEQARSWKIQGPHGPIHGRTIGNGPPLVFLNSLLGDCRLFTLVAWLLRDEFRCVLFDDSSLLLPRSRIIRGSVADLVDDLRAVVDTIEDAPISLFGTGLGAAVGIAGLATAPQAVATAILLGPVLSGRLSGPERWLSRIGCHLPGRLGQLPGFRSLMVHNHHSWFPAPDQSRLGFAIEAISRLPLRVAARRALRFDRLDLGLELDQLASAHRDLAILLIDPAARDNPDPQSTADREPAVGGGFRPAISAITACLPSARIASLTGCGPLGCLTHPHRLAKLIRTFLKGQCLETTAIDDLSQ
jgi:pimeloyl-ACP methyl ester carboxylesterase